MTDIEQENIFLKEKIITLEQKCEQFSQAYDALLHQLKQLLRDHFVKKTLRT